MVLVALVAVMLVAPSAFAQESAGRSGRRQGLMAIAQLWHGASAFGAALGQGRIASAACEGMARNPGAAAAIRAAMILGLVFVETLALFTLVIIFVKI